MSNEKTVPEKNNNWLRRALITLIAALVLVGLLLAVVLARLVLNERKAARLPHTKTPTAMMTSPRPTETALPPTLTSTSSPSSTLTPPSMPVLPTLTAPASATITARAATDTPTTIPPTLSPAHAAYQLALQERAPQHVRAALELLARGTDVDTDAAQLQAQIYYTLDALSDTVYLDAGNTARWELATADGSRPIYPLGLTINRESLYIIDSGTLYRGDLTALAPAAPGLTLTAILTPAATVDGYPLKEIVAVDATNVTDAVFVTDKSNDVYRYEIDSGTWHLDRPQASDYSGPDPLFLNIATYDDRLYILDPSRNQIWRHPGNEYGIEYLPGTLPWLVQPGEPDVSAGIDLAIDGHIYVLRRDGTISKFAPREVAQFSLSVAEGRSHVSGWAELPTRPVAIFANVEGTALYIADAGRRRVVVLDRRDGALLCQLVAPDNPDFAALHDIAEQDGQLYMLAGANLYRYDMDACLDDAIPLTGQLPALQPRAQGDFSMRPGDLLPHDPRLPRILAAYNFQMPIQGSLLPDGGSIYPGARRVYRYGVHQGLDLYSGGGGVEITIGTPVYAAGDGVIVRADVGYQEMTLAEVNALLADAHARHFTPPATLDKLHGRQILIDHGGGAFTRYSHLHGIAAGITVTQRVSTGQLIGYVGVSGTPGGISGDAAYPHLHFEIRTGYDAQYYLGQWLTIEETRRAFQTIFGVPVYRQE